LPAELFDLVGREQRDSAGLRQWVSCRHRQASVRCRPQASTSLFDIAGLNWSVAALPGYISNNVPRSRTRFSADFGGYPGVTLRRPGSTVRFGGAGCPGGTDPPRPGRSEVHLFRYGKGVIDFNSEISDSSLNLGVAKQ